MCCGCGRRTPIKDYRLRKVDTVFGTVRFRSPRIITCECEPPYFMSGPLRPLVPIVPERATPELQALQAQMAAQMSYRRAAELIRAFSPGGRNPPIGAPQPCRSALRRAGCDSEPSRGSWHWSLQPPDDDLKLAMARLAAAGYETSVDRDGPFCLRVARRNPRALRVCLGAQRDRLDRGPDYEPHQRPVGNDTAPAGRHFRRSQWTAEHCSPAGFRPNRSWIGFISPCGCATSSRYRFNEAQK